MTIGREFSHSISVRKSGAEEQMQQQESAVVCTDATILAQNSQLSDSRRHEGGARDPSFHSRATARFQVRPETASSKRRSTVFRYPRGEDLCRYVPPSEYQAGSISSSEDVNEALLNEKRKRIPAAHEETMSSRFPHNQGPAGRCFVRSSLARAG